LQKDSNDFDVTIELLKPVTREEINLKIQVTNLTGLPATVLKSRREDYKWDKIRSLGNYVIEITRCESDSYQLFAPSAEIDPVYEKEEFVTLQNGKSITDTLNISGAIFSRNTESKRGFPPGKYRLKIYFNSDMWRTSEKNVSNWIEFTIE